MVTAAALAEHLVQVEVGHLVSSSSMVSRAYLTDGCVGVVVDAGERGLWLASALSGLAPDPDGLRVRAYEKGGIPVDHGSPRLVKITLRWDDSSVELSNPTVYEGSSGVGVVSLAVPASFAGAVRPATAPKPVAMSSNVTLDLGDSVAIPIATDAGRAVRWARVASDPGFAGSAGAVALDVALAAAAAGSPAFIIGAAQAQFCGLVHPAGGVTSVLVPPAALLDAIPA